MKNPTPLPSQSYLKAIFDYDPETGTLLKNKREVGRAIKSIRRRVMLDNRIYLTSRIIWKYMTGEDPICIDHIDGNTENETFRNLRNVTQQQNNRNMRSQTKAQVPLVGISIETESLKYLVQISNGKRTTRVGTYIHALDAIEARLDAEEQYGYCYRK